MELVDLPMASRLSGAAYIAASPSGTVWILLCAAEARANAQRLNLASTSVVYDRQRPTCSSSERRAANAEPVRAAFRSKACGG